MPTPTPSPVAERMRRYRRRQKAGVQVISLEVDFETVDALIDGGWLTEDDARDSEKIADALLRRARKVA